MSIGPRRTNRLLLEPLRDDHVDEWLAALADPEIGRYIGGPDASDRESLATRVSLLLAGPPESFREQAWINLVVRDLADGSMVGRVEATVYDTWAEIAYVFAPRVWGRGYATEATRELLAVLEELGLVETLAAVHPENRASVDLLTRLGFVALAEPDRPLGSYDPGDLVFIRR